MRCDTWEHATEILPILSELRCPRFKAAWESWCAYRREKRASLTCSTVTAQVRKLDAMGLEGAIAAIERSIEQGWLGLFPVEASPHQRVIAYPEDLQEQRKG